MVNYNECINDVRFRERIFRMPRDYCDLLRKRVTTGVGEQNFKSDAYIGAFLKGKDQMYNANMKTTGVYGADEGEGKVTIALLLLGGGGALDLAVMFDIEP